jgi:hypothetical protein
MKKNHIIAIILLALSITCLVLMGVFLNKDYIHGPKNRLDCEDKSKLPDSCKNDSKCCGVWKDGYCLKGKIINGDECKAKGDVLPLILLILGISLLIGFIVFLVKGFKQTD